MNNSKLPKLTAIRLAALAAAASTTLTLLPACSSVPVPSNVAETDFTLTGGYTDPGTKETYTGSATAAVKYAQSPASPNVATGATAASKSATPVAAPSPSTATSSPQPSPQ